MIIRLSEMKFIAHHLRPIHTKNDNYNNNYIIGLDLVMFILSTHCSYVICHFKCSSSLKFGEFLLAVIFLTVHQLEFFF